MLIFCEIANRCVNFDFLIKINEGEGYFSDL